MSNHLSKMSEFVNAFAEFKRLLNNKFVFKNEENLCRLFDIWLVNYKDEKVLGAQLKKEPWEDEQHF